jgi:hypothetical protein
MRWNSKRRYRILARESSISNVWSGCRRRGTYLRIGYKYGFPAF